ncbi:MAG: CaiB/BaiF CoA-transferase family protein [Actinomycetota bacterium]
MSAPLAGVKVVALEQAVSAPFATRHLADLGADVLKVERPGGDFARHYDTKVGGQAAHFVWANRGKRSIVLDLKHDDDRARFDELIAGADVFVQNLSPAAAGRAGILAHQLVERHPGLIACDISGYGLGGPRTDDKAYDLAIQAEAGAIALTGSADEPSKVGFAAADIASGMYAMSSILAALYRRAMTGEGAAISLSMLECLAEWTQPQILMSVADGRSLPRDARRHASITPYGLFPLADGSQVLVAVQSDREWVAFSETVLERPDLTRHERYLDNAARMSHIDALEDEVRAVFTSVPADELRRRLVEARIAHASVREPGEVFIHEQLAARDRLLEVQLPGGRTATVFTHPFSMSGMPPPNTVVPELDEH